MSVSSKNWSRSSSASRKSLRSGKTLVEKIRELGINYRTERIPTWVSLQQIDVKYAFNQPSRYTIVTPTLNLEQITYYQPELDEQESVPGKEFYKIGKLEVNSKGSKEIKRISDIEVKSYKPNKKIKFKKKKRHSVIINRIEEILQKGKPDTLTREPSEETVYLEQKIPESEKDINDLPENILIKIFLFFNLQERNLTLASVCKSWYYILKDPVFWTEFDFHGSKVPKKIIIELINRYPLVKKLHLTQVPEVDEILLELCRSNNVITDLRVKNCIVESQDFARIIMHVISCCTNLETLNIKGMKFQSERFFLELGRLKNLKSLNLTGNNMMRSQDLITLSVNCRTLEELRILDISVEGGQGCLTNDDLIFIVGHLQQNLRVLKVDMQHFRSASYQEILKCSHLTSLSLINSLHLSSETFREFPALKKLKKLKLTRAINLKTDDFQFVFNNESMSGIEDLNIDGCWGVGGGGLRVITENLTSLNSLSLKNCKSIREEHVPYFSSCSKLTHLNISYTDVDCNCLIPLCQNVKTLNSLVLGANICKKSIIQHLQKFHPFLKIKLSLSEFQKDEVEL